MQSMAVDEEQNPLRQKANEARARLVGGEPFGDVARALSSGPAALLGGELGCLSKSYGLGYDELSKAVASLKTGEISQVIDTPRGLHVVQVEAQVDAAKLEEVGRRHVARGLYTHFAADEAAHKFASDLIERVKAGQKLEDAVREATEQAAKSRPAPAAKPHAGKTPIASPETQALAASDRPHFEVSAPFPRSGNPLPDLEPKHSIAAKAFELSKPDQIVDKPLETASGWVLFQLKERTAPEKAEAEELRATLLQYKADEAVAEYVAGLRKAAGAKLVVDGSFGEDKSRTTDDE
jgi:parvulin-like peptidyl-prolyl isomerase